MIRLCFPYLFLIYLIITIYINIINSETLFSYYPDSKSITCCRSLYCGRIVLFRHLSTRHGLSNDIQNLATTIAIAGIMNSTLACIIYPYSQL